MKPAYSLDNQTLYRGDNVAVMKTLREASIDLVVTSPPYDNLRTYGGHSWDFPAVAEQLTRLLKPGSAIVWIVADATIDGSETGTSMRQALHFKDVCGLWLYDTMIWDKDSVTTPTESRYYAAFEYMFVFSKGPPTTVNLLCDRINLEAGRVRADSMKRCGKEGRAANTDKVYVTPKTSRRMNVWRINPSRDQIEACHAAIFPEAIARDHILSWSNPGDTVLDPFYGSGTTLKMAKETGRRGIGIEIEPSYIEISINRLRQGVLFGAPT